jgi:hypothetical protein
MIADEVVKRYRPLRAWRTSQFAVLERSLLACLHDWTQAWGIDGVAGELRCAPACDPDLDAAWRTIGARAGGAAWIAEPLDLNERMALALFATPEANTPVVQRVCAACMQDLRERLGAALQLVTTTPGEGAAPAAMEWSTWSGAVQARLPFDARLLLAGAAAAAVLGQEGATAPQPQIQEAPLVAVADAMAEVRVPVAAHLGPCALGLGTLRGLQLGDVVHLGHRLDQPVQVRDGVGRTLFDAFLSRDGHHKAVELAAVPTTTAATAERALP